MSPLPGPGVWTSLEIAKLAASILTPLSVAVLGLYLGRAAKLFEARQWANQKVIEKRLLVYDHMCPLLNDLLCYLCRIGNWKEKTPPEIILAKRTLDRHAYIYRPLFSKEFFEAYQVFIGCCFRTWNGEGHDARIMTDGQKHKEAFSMAKKAWDASWDERFDSAGKAPVDMVEANYEALMTEFSRQLGVGLSAPTSRLMPRKKAV